MVLEDMLLVPNSQQNILKYWEKMGKDAAALNLGYTVQKFGCMLTL